MSCTPASTENACGAISGCSWTGGQCVQMAAGKTQKSDPPPKPLSPAPAPVHESQPPRFLSLVGESVAKYENEDKQPVNPKRLSHLCVPTHPSLPIYFASRPEECVWPCERHAQYKDCTESFHASNACQWDGKHCKPKPGSYVAIDSESNPTKFGTNFVNRLNSLIVNPHGQ